MNRKLRSALIFTVLTYLFPVYVFSSRPVEDVSLTSLLLIIFLALVGIIYSLNVMDKRFKWIMTGMNFIIFLIFGYYTLFVW